MTGRPVAATVAAVMVAVALAGGMTPADGDPAPGLTATDTAYVLIQLDHAARSPRGTAASNDWLTAARGILQGRPCDLFEDGSGHCHLEGGNVLEFDSFHNDRPARLTDRPDHPHGPTHVHTMEETR